MCIGTVKFEFYRGKLMILLSYLNDYIIYSKRVNQDETIACETTLIHYHNVTVTKYGQI